MKGFSAQNIWRMKQFYETYSGNEKLSPLVREITWTNNLLIMTGCKTDEAREFYLRLCITNRYTKRELDRQISSMLYERTMLSSVKNQELIAGNGGLAALRDSYVFEFLDLEDPYIEKTDENVYKATVSGSGKTPYAVELRIDYPRKSKCNCPHANGRRIICKHIVAAYFTVRPDEADAFYTEQMAYAEEEERRKEELCQRVNQYVWKMKKSELQQALLELLLDGPEWQYDRFVRENGLDDEWG